MEYAPRRCQILRPWDPPFGGCAFQINLLVKANTGRRDCSDGAGHAGAELALRVPFAAVSMGRWRSIVFRQLFAHLESAAEGTSPRAALTLHVAC